MNPVGGASVTCGRIESGVTNAVTCTGEILDGGYVVSITGFTADDSQVYQFAIDLEYPQFATTFESNIIDCRAYGTPDGSAFQLLKASTFMNEFSFDPYYSPDALTLSASTDTNGAETTLAIDYTVGTSVPASAYFILGMNKRNIYYEDAQYGS